MASIHMKRVVDDGIIASSTRQSPSIDEQRSFWNWHWQNVESRKVLNDWTERRALEMLALIRGLSLSNPRILDFGCGQGWFTERLAGLGEAHGIDLSPEGIEAARLRRPDIDYVVGNVYDTLLPCGFFDVLISSEVIAHVDDQSRYLERAAQVLKPGGYLIITTGNKFVMERLGDVGWNVQPPQHIARQLSRRQLSALLMRAGFTVLKSLTIIPHGHRGILRIVNSYRLNSALRSFVAQDKLDAFKEKMGLGWQMIFLAQKDQKA